MGSGTAVLPETCVERVGHDLHGVELLRDTELLSDKAQDGGRVPVRVNVPTARPVSVLLGHHRRVRPRRCEISPLNFVLAVSCIWATVH